MLKVPPLHVRDVTRALQESVFGQTLTAYIERWSTADYLSMVYYLTCEDYAPSAQAQTLAETMRHRLSAEYEKRQVKISALPRSLGEIALLEAHPASEMRAHVESHGLLSYVVHIARSMFGKRELRRSHVGTKRDSQGEFLRYPESKLIIQTLDDFSEYLVTKEDWDSRDGIALMNLVFNVHPFEDGNGRVGRFLMNQVCRSFSGRNFFIPIYELSALSAGGFILSIREAQYFNRWEPLLEFFDKAARYMEQVSDDFCRSFEDGKVY